MDEKQLFALLGQCKSIRKNVSDVLSKHEQYYSAFVDAVYDRERNPLLSFSSDTEQTLKSGINHLAHEVDTLLDAYRNAYNQAYSLGVKVNPVGGKLSPEGACRRIMIECDSIISAIESTMSPLTVKQRGVLENIQEETKELFTHLDMSFETNINMAIKNLNDNDSLGSALISARTLDYMLSQLASAKYIQGDSIEEKLKYLVDKKVLEDDRDTLILAVMKAEKKVRNLLDHNIKFIPDTSNSIALLGDCVYVMKIYDKAIQLKNK